MVEYSCPGFLEKNRDTVSKELVNVLRLSDIGIVRKLMSLDDVAEDSGDANRSLGGRVVISAAKAMVSSS